MVVVPRIVTGSAVDRIAVIDVDGVEVSGPAVVVDMTAAEVLDGKAAVVVVVVVVTAVLFGGAAVIVVEEAVVIEAVVDEVGGAAAVVDVTEDIVAV